MNIFTFLKNPNLELYAVKLSLKDKDKFQFLEKLRQARVIWSLPLSTTITPGHAHGAVIRGL